MAGDLVQGYETVHQAHHLMECIHNAMGYAPINVKPHPTQYRLCGALGGDLNLNFASRGGEFEQTLYSSIDPLQ